MTLFFGILRLNGVLNAGMGVDKNEKHCYDYSVIKT